MLEVTIVGGGERARATAECLTRAGKVIGFESGLRLRSLDQVVSAKAVSGALVMIYEQTVGPLFAQWPRTKALVGPALPEHVAEFSKIGFEHYLADENDDR